MVRKRPTQTNVKRNNSFSKPRLENEVPPPPPKVLPSPVPLAWTIIRTIKITDITICATVKNNFMLNNLEFSSRRKFYSC